MNEDIDNLINMAADVDNDVPPQAVEVGEAQADASLPDQMWLEFNDGSPVLLADSLRQRGARLLGLTAYPNPNGEATICYHFVLPAPNGESVFNAKFVTRNRLLPSIGAIYAGAGWQEEALGERYNVAFRDEGAPVAGMLNG